MLRNASKFHFDLLVFLRGEASANFDVSYLIALFLRLQRRYNYNCSLERE